MKFAKPKIELRAIPPLTVDEDAFLMREYKFAPWKRMTRQEIEDQYPGELGRFDKAKDNG
jgi:broad specificity phosphatase PhoE